jgi:hypothetical protein
MSACKIVASSPIPSSCVDPRTFMVNGLTLSIVFDVGRVVTEVRVELGQRPRTTEYPAKGVRASGALSISSCKVFSFRSGCASMPAPNAEFTGTRRVRFCAFVSEVSRMDSYPTDLRRSSHFET